MIQGIIDCSDWCRGEVNHRVHLLHFHDPSKPSLTMLQSCRLSIEARGLTVVQFVINAIALPFALLNLVYQRIAGTEEVLLDRARWLAGDSGSKVLLFVPQFLVLHKWTHDSEAAELEHNSIKENSYWLSLKVRGYYLAQIIRSTTYLPFLILNDFYQKFVTITPPEESVNHLSILLKFTLRLITPLHTPKRSAEIEAAHCLEKLGIYMRNLQSKKALQNHFKELEPHLTELRNRIAEIKEQASASSVGSAPPPLSFQSSDQNAALMQDNLGQPVPENGDFSDHNQE